MSLESSLRKIFDEALDREDPAEQSRYLDAACGTDDILRARVERLLQAHNSAGRFLAGSESDMRTRGWPGTTVEQEQAGQNIGRYKLLEQIGEGGCGRVYMAEQEEPVRRRVALKIIKLGMDTRSVIARFEAERQALAMMDHSNIARVFDAGATETGRPYFVMELVRGVKITDYCDQNSLTTEDRLLLFVQVCKAVQHAHQKGIIHRDIKPANVLVTLHDGVPVPKVIDFGIAKATGQERLTDRTLFTSFQQFIGTPAYMSPEQAEMSGLDIDTRSDIYSLGVLLYELLTGRTPFDSKELLAVGLDGMRRTIREQEPSLPSTRLQLMQESELTTVAKQRQTAPPRLLTMFRGDLDWVVMKCLEKDRTRRYGTAIEAALEVERYLRNEPVTARPANRLYRYQKLVRRNIMAVGAGFAVGIAMVAGLSLSTWMFFRERAAFHRAEANEKKVEQIAQDLRRSLYAADMNLVYNAMAEGNFGTARELLNKHLPQPGVEDLRGWEWRHARKQSEPSDNLVLAGHTSGVISLALAKGGLLASGSDDSAVTVWNLEDRQQLKTLRHNGSVFGLGFGNDDRELIVGTEAGELTFWNCTTWQKLTNFSNLPAIRSSRVSHDGQLLALSAEKALMIWRIATREEVARAPLDFTRDGLPGGIAFAPNSTLLAFGRGDGAIILWDIARREAIGELQGHERLVTTLAFSPDGATLVSGSRDRSVRIWNLDSRQSKLVRTFPHWVGSVNFGPDGALLSVAGGSHNIFILETKTWQDIRVLKGHSASVWASLFASATLVTGGSDMDVRVWAIPANQERLWHRLPRDHDGRVSILPGAGLLYMTHADETYSLWRTDPFEQIERNLIPEPNCVSSIISPDLRCWVGITTSQTARIFQRANHTLIQEVPCATNFRMAAQFSSDGQFFGVVGSDSLARVWRISGLPSGSTTMTQMASFTVNPAPLRGAFLLGKGELFATGDNHGKVQLWITSSGEPAGSFQVKGIVTEITVSDDQSIVAAATTAGAVTLWDAKNRRDIATLAGQPLNLFGLAFSPDQTRIAACGGDGTVRLWELRSRQPVATIQLGKEPLLALGFTADEKLVVLGYPSLDDRLFVLPAERH